MAALDISRESLASISSYELKINCDLNASIPIASDSVDGVVSSFLGYLSDPKKCITR